MTEQQPYEVVDRRDGFELRRYPAHLVAEIDVDGSFDEAPNRAFRPLAGFINGANRSRRQIAMTAPVTRQAVGPEKIAMTAPVVQQAAGRRGSYLVQFVMPSGFTAQTLPVPDDARVRTREIPQQLAAAVRFSGRWTRKEFEDRGSALRRAVVAAGLRPAGPVRYARFNPPWTPWFLRQNEVVQPVKE
ncbi:MAG: SOUL family heme-binding protein [Micromonosporaceae bacterium]